MENSEPLQTVQAAKQANRDNNLGLIMIFVVTFILVVTALWQFSGEKIEKSPIDSSELVNKAPKKETIEEPKKETIEEPVERKKEPEAIKDTRKVEPINTIEQEVEMDKVAVSLPTLDESDAWLHGKLPDLTWRNELLSLFITEDMIRRFVVFTDNFSQGLIAYEHSPFIKPKVRFSVDEQALVEGEQNVWQWDSTTTKRFDLYVDLLRSVDSNTLVSWYYEAKPLIDEAYSELGYEDDFTYTLQDAITRVLDMELPKSSMALTRTSVMYKYQDSELELLADSDKLLLRIGKENLLIIKSVLLEFNEKLIPQADNKS